MMRFVCYLAYDHKKSYRSRCFGELMGQNLHTSGSRLPDKFKSQPKTIL